jgi:hypothetical protein
MIVEIDDDCIDKIVSQEVMKSYIWLTKDAKIAKKNPDAFHPDDVASWEKLIPALEEVGRYFTYDWDGKLKKMKKAMKK